ncbi:MAG TPA: UvrD-helicase domain-containing protein, partial [Opitutales bacterium]|nr:UvrD-helicase domain-containing protein [Opitutales bacterium]
MSDASHPRSSVLAQLTPGALAPIDFTASLNEDQLAAVTAPPGPALVLAGAGSGKTRTLTYRVAWLVHQGMDPWNILLLTFTNKAAKEMLLRVEDLTGLNRWGGIWGGTFHSVGQRFLRTHGKAVGVSSGFTILDEDDADALLSDVIRKVDPAFNKHKEHPKPGLIKEVFSYACNTRQSINEVITEKYPWFEEISEPLHKFRALYQQTKLEKQVLDYDDLLEYWLLTLQRDEA